MLAAAAGVGLGHAILPDHWVPLAVVGRTRRYPLARVARLSLLAGVAHVLVSLVLGAIIIAVGLQFRSTIESAQNTIIGAVLFLTGVGFAALELSNRGHGHSHALANGHSSEHGSDLEHSGASDHVSEHAPLHPPAESDAIVATGESRVRGLAAIMVPFGAAASPDLTILPIFLAATAAGVFAAVGALVVFCAVTIGTIVGLTLFACFGGYQLHGQWLDRWGNMFTAGVLVAIGALVFTSVI
jgi:nickel/cobalt transporter (NicO) family protein